MVVIAQIREKALLSYFYEMICQLNHYGVVLRKPTSAHTLSFTPLRIRYFHCCRPANYLKLESSIPGRRVSRVVRTEAQDVLFDYLHCTRSFHLTDAEHMSKNSPHFLQKLLSKVENEQDVARSLSKFLRYNPINEFEPFFESLGLAPSEISALLPRNLMFLSDDCVMIENYHVLCDYGIARSSIGRMYKEVQAIFRYELGLLGSKVRAYEGLGLSRSTVIKLVSCCPWLLVGGVNSQFVMVLKRVKGLGFESDWIGGYLSGKSSYNWKRMHDTIDFLEKVGYSEEQMVSLFKTNPELLFEGSGKKFYVLIGRLLKLGFKMKGVLSLFLQNPQILSKKCVKNLWQAVGFLFEIGMKVEDIVSIVSSHVQLLCSCSLKGPRTVLRSLKVGREGLCQIIKEDPSELLSLASKSKINSMEHVTCQNPSKHLEKTTFLLRLGYVENSDEMFKALKLFRGRGDQLQERFDCLVQAGLDCNVVSNMIKQAPSVLNQTKYVIEKKIDCLRNCLGYPLQSVVAFPSYLCYDIERINLRFSMYVWLRDKGAAKSNLSLSTILACSDARFVKYFVDVHPEGPAQWERLRKLLP